MVSLDGVERPGVEPEQREDARCDLSGLYRPVAGLVVVDTGAGDHERHIPVVRCVAVRAADVTRSWRVKATRLDFGSLTVADRIAALGADPPRQSWWRVAGLCLVVAATAFATVRAYNSLDLVYDAAQRAAAIYR